MSENSLLKNLLKDKFCSKEEIRILIKQYKESQDETLKTQISEKILKNNIRYIKKISSKFSRLYIDPEDSFQNGVLGFYSALEKFDLTKQTAFTTYLFYWVYKSIYENAQIYPVEVPRNIQHMNSIFSKYKNIVEHNDEKNHSEFLNKKVIQSKAFQDKYVNKENGPVDIGVVYLDSKEAVGDSKFKNVINLIKDDSSNPESLVLQKGQRSELLKLISEKLNDKQKSVIMLRYFSDTDNLLALHEIGSKLDLSAERVRQIEYTALIKLKKALFSLKKAGNI